MYQNIKTIAILRALYLGDMLCIIPTVRALRTAYPEAHITLIGLPWQENFVARFHHYFDGFIEFPGWPGLPERAPDPAACVAFLQHMQHQRFDLVLQMQGNGAITNSLCMLFGAGKVCGLRKENDYSPDDNLFPIGPDDEHEILRFLKLADALDVPRQGDALEFPFFQDEIHEASGMLEAMHLPEGNFFCVHPGARDPKRRWTAKNFAWVADRLAGKGYTILLTGSQEEANVLQNVANLMTCKSINLVERFGQVGIGELGYIISRGAGLLSNDTGVSHVAAALEIPSVVIFSPFSLPTRWAPLNSDLHKIILTEDAENLDYVVTSLLQNVKSLH